jgi:hypothetical protein
VFAVQMRCGRGGDEKLGAVCVGSGIRHGQQEWAIMLEINFKEKEMSKPKLEHEHIECSLESDRQLLRHLSYVKFRIMAYPHLDTYTRSNNLL